MSELTSIIDRLLVDVRALVVNARIRAAVTVNRELVMLYYDIGQRLRTEILGEQRAAYGEQIVSTLSRQLTALFGRGFSDKNLFRMIQLTEFFPDRAVVEKLSEVLSWSHFVEV